MNNAEGVVFRVIQISDCLLAYIVISYTCVCAEMSFIGIHASLSLAEFCLYLVLIRKRDDRRDGANFDRMLSIIEQVRDSSNG